LNEKLASLWRRLTQTVLGSEEPSFLLLTGLLANGHVLIQGAPGIGKTSLAHALADSVDCSFKRIQFTPDLLPSDILGYSMFSQADNRFHFIEGPVFSNIVLADEINRTSPRIQSALLECMNEHQVSIDGVTRQLGNPFMVIATQNNLYASGTFPLPEPQLDRFLVAITMKLPDSDTQSRILELHASGAPSRKMSPVISTAELQDIQRTVATLPVDGRVCRYIVELCDGARAHQRLGRTLSSRAAIAIMRAAQAVAYMESHAAVHPDDVKRILKPVLTHRLNIGKLHEESENEAMASLDEVMQQTRVP
jgi:MoxR-like ATPase